MNNPLDRRIAKLEAAARATTDSDAFRVVFVHPGENAADKLAAAGPMRHGEQLFVVRFVRAEGDRPSRLH